MLFKSPVFSQASGSIAGIVYSRNAGGMYTRARAMPTNPNTEAQQAIRTAMADLVVYWTETLGTIERESWNNYAFNTPTLNRLGEPTHKSGQQMFLRGNIPRVQAGLPIAQTGPTFFDLGDFTNPGPIAVDASLNQVSITYDDADTWANEEGSAMLIYQSRPQNPTRNFGKGPFQLLTMIEGDALTPPVSPVTATSLFTVAEGQKVFFQIRVTRADGRLSALYNPAVIVVA